MDNGIGQILLIILMAFAIILIFRFIRWIIVKVVDIAIPGEQHPRIANTLTAIMIAVILFLISYLTGVGWNIISSIGPVLGYGVSEIEAAFERAAEERPIVIPTIEAFVPPRQMVVVSRAEDCPANLPSPVLLPNGSIECKAE